MQITGDSIIIKDDFNFDRIENLKLGDSILGPEGETIITKIESNYTSNNYILKSKNFYPFYIGENTKILTIKEIELLNKNNKYQKIFKEEEFSYIKDIFPTNLLCLSEISLNQIKNIENPLLYALLLPYSKYIEDKNLIRIDNVSLSKKIKKTNKNIELKNNKTYLELQNLKYDWLEDFICKVHQRKINKALFESDKETIKSFIDKIIKEHTKLYQNENDFRCYFESKILSIQLFYLLLYIYKKLPYLEVIEKDRVEYKRIPQANKKKKYSITMLSQYETLLKDNLYIQEIEKINKIDKNIRMYNIETLDNKPFYLNNIIIKP